MEVRKGVRWVGVLGLALTLVGASSRASDTETPPTFRASEILPPELASGDYFRVAESVRNDGYFNHFTIESDWGVFEAPGLPILKKRVQEVHALARLDEVSKLEVFGESAKDAVIRQGETIADFADRPVETLKAVPAGVGRMFRKYKRDAKELKEEVDEEREERQERKAEKEAQGEGEGDDGLTKEEVKELSDDAVDAGSRYAKRYFGTTRAERKWAEELQVDPYSSNEVLMKELKKVARVDAAGSFSMRFAPIPRIPGVDYLATANMLAWSLDPRELQQHNQKLLMGMGVSEEQLEAFFDVLWLSPSRQTRIVAGLASLEGVEDVTAVIDQAIGLESLEQAYFLQQGIEMLTLYHLHEEPLKRLVAITRVPAAITSAGRLVAFASLDHISYTEEMRDATEEFFELSPEIPFDRRELVLRGSASDLFRQEVEGKGVRVRQDFGAKMLEAVSE